MTDNQMKKTCISKKDAFENMAVYLNFIKCYYHYNDYSCICNDRNHHKLSGLTKEERQEIKNRICI